MNLEQLNTQLFINGEWTEALSGEVMSVINPTNRSLIASVAKADQNDVAKAYEAAAQAFLNWYAMGWKKRSLFIEEFKSKIKQNKEWLAQIDSINSGNPIKGMLRDIDSIVNRIEQSIHFAAAVHGSTVESSGVMNLHYTRFEPFGVVARIIPFNHPVLFAATKIIPPLIMGNTVILKPSDYTPLSALALGEFIKDIFPPGVVNIITGDAVAGQAIISHPKIKRIGFTGSANTGKKILQEAAKAGIKNISMELGGKNPMIVFPDADVSIAAKHALTGMGYGSTQGQSCGSNSRIFVHQDICVEFTKELSELTEQLVIGDPLETKTDIGPLITEQQMQRVLSYIEVGISEGARLIQGGKRPKDGVGNKGYFVTPTIFTHVTQNMRIAQEEIFGPVTSILTWNDYEQMIHEANDIEYGLTASIWTQNLKWAHQTAHKLKAGYIWMNTSAKHFEGLPFGGYKNSGIGREESIDELISYCETKVVNLNLEE